MENKVLISKLLYVAKKSGELYNEKMEKTAKKCNISKQEADVLMFFKNNPQYTNACDAVTYRGFSKAYVSKALLNLTKKGYISIKTDVEDRRYQHIIINESAKQIIEKLTKTQISCLQQMLSGMEREELENFINVVEKMADHIIEEID